MTDAGPGETYPRRGGRFRMLNVAVSRMLSVAHRGAAYWRYAVAALLVVMMLATVDIEQLLETLAGASPIWVAVSVVLMITMLALSAANVWLLLRCSTKIPFREFARVYATSWTFGLLLPGQLGDASQVVLLQRRGVPLSASSAAYAFDKFISMTWLVSLGTIGVCLYLPRAYLVAAVVLFLAALATTAVAWRVARTSTFAVPVRFERAREAIIAFVAQLARFRRHRRVVATNMSVTVLRWGVTTAWYAAVFQAVGQPVTWAGVAIIPIMASLVGYLPISVAGLGTSEFTAVTFYQIEGIGAPAVLSVWLINRITQYSLAALVMVASRRYRIAPELETPGDVTSVVPGPHRPLTSQDRAVAERKAP